ncbi:hypothetical protein ACSBRB_08695 [Staphylococcus auricularis]|uniref:hypothetical protein n=1 Tax=Staphylococcus auricularis TaxID=29379 RepID=UPI003EC11DD5
MAKKSKVGRLSSIVNLASGALEIYTRVNRSNNKNLLYLNLGVSTLSIVLDSFTSIKSPHKIRKLWSIFTLGLSMYHAYNRYKQIKAMD